MNREDLEKLAIDLEQEMLAAAEELRFEYAARLRDEIKELRREIRRRLRQQAWSTLRRCPWFRW